MAPPAVRELSAADGAAGAAATPLRPSWASFPPALVDAQLTSSAAITRLSAARRINWRGDRRWNMVSFSVRRLRSVQDAPPADSVPNVERAGRTGSVEMRAIDTSSFDDETS